MAMRFTPDWRYLLLALLMATFAWSQVSGARVESWQEIPVETSNAPKDLVILQQNPPGKLLVRMRGPRGLIRGLDAKTLAYPLDLSGLKPGQNTIVFDPRRVPVSRSIEILETFPQRYVLNADRLAFKIVPVKFNWTTPPEGDVYVLDPAVTPTEVQITGPESELATVTLAPTRTTRLAAERSGPFNEELDIILPENVEAFPPRVRATAALEVKTREAWTKAPITLSKEDLPRITRIEPDEVRVKVNAPAPLLRKKALDTEISATVEVPKNLTPGRHEVEVRVTLGDDLDLVEIKPGKVHVVVK